jgi:hypothetical protein
MFKAQSSPDFGILFLSEFTKELIKGTDTYLKLKIKEEVKRDNLRRDLILESSKSIEQKKEIKNLVVEKMKQDMFLANKIRKSGDENLILRQNPFRPPRSLRPVKVKPQKEIFPFNLNFIKPRRRIQEPQLPTTVRHLRPSPTEIQIDLGKLNSLAKDPLVKIIEVPGKNQKVLVSGMMGNKHTKIVLSENEIREIVKRFAFFSKIPLEEGFFKAAVGNFVLSAILSDQESGSRFVLKKIGGY